MVDGWTARSVAMATDDLKAIVAARIAEIKAHMPEVYRAIQARAVEQPGTFGLVRRALAGEPNCFYAIERGRAVGTPFNMTDIMAEVAKTMVQFGCTYVCIWQVTAGSDHGAH
jgi:hypothetical protein